MRYKMKKPYLLIVGQNYYPARGTGNWVGCFETEDEAHSKLATIPEYQNDWYEIVDLRDWTDEE